MWAKTLRKIAVVGVLLGPPLAHAQPALIAEYNHAWQLTGQAQPEESVPLLKRIITQDERFYRAYATLVEAYRQEKRLDEGETYFRSLLALNPRNGLAYYALGRIADLRKDHSVALDDMTRCVKNAPPMLVCYGWLVNELVITHHNHVSIRELNERLPAPSATPYRWMALAKLNDARLDRPGSIRYAERALALARRKQDRDLVARVDSLLSDYDQSMDQPAKALSLVRAALAIYRGIGVWEDELEVSARLSEVYMRLGNPAEALDCLQSALERSVSLRHHEFTGLISLRLGDLHFRQGDNDAAMQDYTQAQREFEAIGIVKFTALQRIGDVYEARGDLPHALTAFEAYRRAAEEFHEPWDEAFALRRMGDVYRDSGDYFKALWALSRAVQMFRAMGRKDNVGAGLRVTASIEGALGNYTDALAHYEESFREAQAVYDLDQEQRIRLGMGELYLRMGEPRNALTSLDEALRIFEHTRYTNLRPRALLDEGDADRMLGDLSRAFKRLTEALAMARQMHRQQEEAQALIGLGELDLVAGRLAEAEKHFRESLGLAEAFDFAECILAAQRALSATLVRKGNDAEALRHLQKAVETVESLRGRIPTPELRSDFTQKNWALYQDTIALLAGMHRHSPAEGYDRVAFNYAEKGRARSFLDLLAESRARITRGLTSAQREREDVLFADLSRASSAVRQSGSAASRKALLAAERNLTDWSLELRETNSQYQHLQYPQPENVAQVQAMLTGTGITILEYVLGEERSYVWAVSAKHFQMASLPGRRALELEVEQFRKLSSVPPDENAPHAWEASARRLYQSLLEPVEAPLAGTNELLIIPDGLLYYLPFEALVRPQDASPHYLLEDYAVSYAPSATVFSELASDLHTNGQGRRELLAYGDPVFDGRSEAGGLREISRIVRSAYQSQGITFQPLPNTRIEVENIARFFTPENRKVVLGVDATEASVKQEKLSDYKRIHFATHAVIDEELPWRSGVVLSLVNTGVEDGILRANEIFNLNLKADLVVLSACQTGLGKFVRGEGIVGLTRAFFYAGAQRVIVSLWSVNDVATAEFMKVLYDWISRGNSPATALRQAKLTMIHSDVIGYRHPYFWSAFVLNGRF